MWRSTGSESRDSEAGTLNPRGLLKKRETKKIEVVEESKVKVENVEMHQLQDWVEIGGEKKVAEGKIQGVSSVGMQAVNE